MRIASHFLLIGSLALFAANSPLTAQVKTPPKKNPEDGVLPGHSQHGEIFNEGPRQKAYLMKGTGKVHFPATTKNPTVQAFIDQGVGQLHGFWYLEAERSFRQAAKLDPDCAIAYWGMAMANSSNTKRSKGFIAEAMKRLKHADDRETMYIKALNKYITTKGSSKKRQGVLLKDYLAIAKKFSYDVEAWAMVGYLHYRLRSAVKTATGIFDKVLKMEPMHPLHHYVIHYWDTRGAQKALESAARCGQSAPAIAHMWHMPGHIYSRLKRYEDAVWQQEASARVDHAHMMRDRVMPDQIHNFAHNNEWLIRNMMYIGRVNDAVDLAKNMISLPRHPKYNSLTRGSSLYGRRRLFEVLYRYELWQELIDCCTGPYLEATTTESEQLKRLRHLGIAYVRIGNAKAAEAVLAELKTMRDKKPGRRFAGRVVRRTPTIDNVIEAIQGHQAAAAGDYKEAVALLKKAGGEDSIQLARLRYLADEKDAAVKSGQYYVKTKQKQVRPLAALVELHWLNGQKEEAKKVFDELRELSNSVQFGSPVFARLEPIAKELKLPTDWRIKRSPPKDVGIRPTLDSLGTFRWSPSPAEDWTLQDAEGKTHSLKDFRGKPVIVVFYLGYGCLHCAEQIQALAPKATDFAKEGISIIAVSTDDLSGLKISHANYKKGPIPFPLVSDAKLDVFKKYRCHDDFEDQPLHGTFLIDGEGRVRWQDISYEPFMNVQFLLDESKRLLAHTPPKSIQ